MDKKMLIGKKCLSVCLAVLMLFSSLGGSMVTMAEEITEKPQTEALSETQTEPQTAAPATEAPQAVTEAVPVTEQALTEAPAEIPMEAPTEAPTEAATQTATEPATETANYHLLLPVYQECDYQYDALREDPETEAESQKKQRSLLYEANEKAELSILPREGWQIKELHLYYQEGSKKEEAAYQWLSDYRLAFVMPACDVLLDVSFVTLDTERPQESEGETQGALQTESNLTETEMQSTENQTGQPDLPEPETGREETLPEETETPMAETEGDGLPAQGSVVQMGMVTLPFDTWEFDPETDFRGMEEYDLELFDIDYISDGILYDVPGIYDSVYRVAKKGIDKFWFALRPVRVAEEGELTETETETVTDAITENMTETFPEETEAATEAQTQPPMDVPESESELQEMNSETITEAATEGMTETETEASEETADPQVYINGGVNCTITLAEDSVLIPGEVVRYTVTPDEGFILQGTNVFQVEAPDQMEAFLTDNDMGLIVKEPVDYEMGEPDEDGNVEVSFFMPESCVLIEAAAEDPKADGGISLFTELGEDLGKVNFTTPYGGGTWYAYPDKFTKTGGLGTVVKTFTIYDKNGKVLKEGVYGFCLESSKDTAGPTTNAPFTELDQESEVLLAKALFYLSHGPGWGHDFTGTDGKVRNFTDIYNSYGLTSNQHCYSMTHLVLSKIYAGYQTDPNWSWNAGCTSDRMHSYSNILNADGIAFVNDIINQLKKMGYPSCDLTPTTIPTNEVFQVNDRFVTPTIQYTSLSANYLTIPVDDKTWLVNESTGKTVHNGDALVKGGQSFHLEIDKSMEGKKVSYTATPKLYGSAGMYKVSIGQGSQDMAFSYSMEGLKFNVTISKIPPYEEPKAYIEIQKQDQETGQAIPQTGGSFAGAQYTIYRDADCKVVEQVLTTDSQGYVKSTSLKLNVYYVRETKAPVGYELDPTVHKVEMGAGDAQTIYRVISKERWIRKSIEVQKQDQETGQTVPQAGSSFAGAEYTIYRDAGCTNAVEVLTTNASGYAKSSLLDPNTYYVKETKAPAGYELDPTLHTVVMDSSPTQRIYRVISKELQIRKSIEVQKQDQETGQTVPQAGRSFAGAEYTIYRDSGCTDMLEVLKTNESGYAKSAEYPLGTYYVKETKAPAGYYLDPTVYTVNLQDGDGILTYSIRSKETPVPVYIEIQKQDQETGQAIPQTGGSFAGAQYTIYRNEACTDTAEVLTTDGKGYAKSSRLIPAIYYVKETKAPEGYYLDPTVYAVDARNGNGKEVFPVTSLEELIKKPIELQKYDKELGETGPNNSAVTLAGAEYTIYRDAGCTDVVEVLTTDENGYAKSSDLTVGTYFVKETKAPEGYLPDETVTAVSVADDGKAYYQVTSKEQVIRGSLSIMKYLDDNTDSSHLQDLYDKGILAGITFTLTHEDPKVDPVVIVTDRYGYAATKDQALVYGTWKITESNTPEGYEGIEEETITIKEDGERLRYVIANNQPLLAIKLQKKDAKTGNLIPIKGAKFQILDGDGKPITMPDNLNYKVLTDTFTTDEDGEIKLTSGLPVGTYTIHEVAAPEGYLLAADQELVITKEMMDQETELVVACVDEPQLGNIRIQKVDQDTQEHLQEGFGFEIKVARDITDAAGTIRKMEIDGVETELTAGTVVAYVKTDETGMAESPKLYLGTYLVTEAEAANHYAVNQDKREVTLSNDQEVEEVTYDLTVEDEKTKLEIYKVDSDSNEEQDLPLSGITFRIFTAKDLEDAGLDPNGKLEAEQLSKLGTEYVTDLNGKILVTDLEQDMTYYVFEAETLPGYNLAQGLYRFHVDGQGLIDGKPVYSLKISNTANQVEISKKDITGDEELPGATLTVKDSEGTVVDQWVSTKEPHRIKGLPAGDYVLMEEKAPEGYAIAEAIHFTLTDSLEVQQVVMYDERLQVQVSKKDITNQEELPGATLTVKDSEGTVVDQWVSTDQPHVVNLTVGKYTLTEVAAPEKYATAASVEFEIKEDLSVTTVEMLDAPIQVEISKKDITDEDELPGAKLTVTDSDGNIVEEWISTAEPHKMNLAAGTYTLTEVAAPEKYAKAESIVFTVADTAEIQKVTMYDQLIQVEISKKDITNEEELPGAKLTVTDPDGNIVEEWISTAEPHKMNLAAGTYTLTEVAAPEKYAKAESIEFTVTDSMEVQKVTMYDQLIQVEISKKDITNEEELPGAKLTVKDSQGNLVEEWISTEKPHKMNLAAGTYTLTEVTAPKGYEVADSLEFTVTDSMEVQTVKMYDAPKEETVDLTGKTDKTTTTTGGGGMQPGNPVTNVIAQAVQTGDFNRYLPAVGAVVAGLITLLVLFFTRKKKGNEKGSGRKK